MRIFKGKRTEKGIEVEEVTDEYMMLVPPSPHLCQECAENHPPEFPHNLESIYYQTKFLMEHDRAATWADAIAHCPDDIKEFTISELRKLGIEVYQS
ncbi:MAG TPA: hypothetical protein DEA44_15285 [Firmicutes bacterium]|nr:hypothetical protein [Bacillota bacterium]